MIDASRSKAPIPVAIVGCVGLPPGYGGFETLAANLVRYRDAHDLPYALSVYCSTRAYRDRPDHYGGARLRYVPLDANGASSIFYDAISLIQAVVRGNRTILVLGVSGAVVFPLIRLVSRVRLVVNIDGLEWKRAKWSRSAAWFLRLSEWIAVRSAHVVIADNRGIVDHVKTTYGRAAVEIPYGGDHAVVSRPLGGPSLKEQPAPYALMLCRIEPENNIHLILDSFARADTLDLTAVGNWSASDYGRTLRDRYRNHPRLHILDPVFDSRTLGDLRAAASLYVHGHSAGGTNPALVEMMHFGMPVVAFDCTYNRHTTEGMASYFATAEDLVALVAGFRSADRRGEGDDMREIARRRYTWDIVGHQYFAAIGSDIDG